MSMPCPNNVRSAARRQEKVYCLHQRLRYRLVVDALRYINIVNTIKLFTIFYCLFVYFIFIILFIYYFFIIYSLFILSGEGIQSTVRTSGCDIGS